jgi:hypothetical protein
VTTSPSWLGDLAALVMVLIALYCTGRVGLARRFERRNNYDDNVAHTLMGLGMAAMFVPRWNHVPAGAGEIVFGMVALYFLAKRVRAARGGAGKGTAIAHEAGCRSHTTMHAVMAGAMVYMYWLMAASTAHPAHTMMSGPPAGAGDPSLTLLLSVVLFGSAVVELDGAVRTAGLQPSAVMAVPGGPGAAGIATGPDSWPFLAPRLESACHVIMCLAMGLMLVLMV